MSLPSNIRIIVINAEPSKSQDSDGPMFICKRCHSYCYTEKGAEECCMVRFLKPKLKEKETTS